MGFFHRYSAIVFFVLGLTFACAYVLFRNEIGAAWPLWWLQVADLPLLLAGLTYGGISIERSLRSPSSPSRLLPYVIFIPIGLLFLSFTALNFWPLLR